MMVMLGLYSSSLATCGLEIIIADRFIDHWVYWLLIDLTLIGQDACLCNKTREVQNKRLKQD